MQKDEFLEILRTGIVAKDQKSNYAKNYIFFQQKIDEFLDDDLNLEAMTQAVDENLYRNQSL